MPDSPDSPAPPATTNSFDPPVSSEDAALLSLFHPVLQEWWLSSFRSEDGLFTPPQRQAIPMISQGKNVLISSPTGSGKTLSAFIAIINQLFVMASIGSLEERVYCLYISPLKSLANDIHRNLDRPLQEIRRRAEEKGLQVQEIRHAIRHGDISAREKARMLTRTPHILNTTPESLAILLSSPRFREKLKGVRWVIVDEIHSLAASKRGVHLSLSLERLEELLEEHLEKHLSEMVGEEPGPSSAEPLSGHFVRIGCSATVEPLEEVAEFLAGYLRPVEVVDCRFFRRHDLRLLCPVPDLILADQKDLTGRLYDLLHRHIQEHGSTLIFTNSRNGAERVLQNLRLRFPQFYTTENSACHHGSMGREGRMDAESRLKEGTLKVALSSTSLEMGIDMPSIDLVLQIGSPKSVAALLQRFGRGGHSLDRVVIGRIIVLERDELMECAVMLQRARRGEVDRIHIPANALDALSQHLVGMTLERDWTISEVLSVVRRSYCYRSLSEEELLLAVLYLSSAHEGMIVRRIYPKIRYDAEKKLIGSRGGSSRMIYYTNSGMIADQFSCDVLTRDGRFLGKLDEKYLEKLDKGDIFSIGGGAYSFCYRRGGKIYVDVASGRANIPTWSSERPPLSFDLAKSVLCMHGDILWMMRSRGMNGIMNDRKMEILGINDHNNVNNANNANDKNDEDIIRWLQTQYPIDRNSARCIFEIFRQQIDLLGEDGTPTGSRIVVQECLDWDERRRVFYFLTGYGLRFNDGLSRMVAYLLARQRMKDVIVTADDSGFVLSLPVSCKVNITGVISSIRAENCEQLLYRAVQNSSLLKSVFRINATRSFMILKSYKGRQKSARRQQLDADMLIGFAGKLDDFAVLRESFREIIEDRFEIENIREVLRGIASRQIEVVVKRGKPPGPMAFGLAALGAAAGEKRERMREMQRAIVIPKAAERC
ncbi:MAG TPA: DEAD/DEAH box helicase [Methanothrix sp.]|nr:DEAD/DEAH box helicase [Methanothrix sp.]